MENKWNILKQYTGNESKLSSIVEEINKFVSNYDMIKKSETEHERQTNNNWTNTIKNAVESAYGRGTDLALNTSYNTIANKEFPDVGPADLIPPRAVGPLEEMPAASMFGSVQMLTRVLSNTQLRTEHLLHTKLATNKKVRVSGQKTITNRYNRENQYVPRNFDPKDFTFRIQNTAFGEGINVGVLDFPGHITNYSENLGADWSALSFVNATEDQYVYQRGDRSFTLEFLLFISDGPSIVKQSAIGAGATNVGGLMAFGVDDIANAINDLDRRITPLDSYFTMTKKEFWDTLQFLNALTRAKLNDSKVIKDVPFCNMTIGSFIKDQMCIFDGVAINYDPMIWDITIGEQSPMFASITLTGKYLHDIPSVDTQFYGVYK